MIWALQPASQAVASTTPISFQLLPADSPLSQGGCVCTRTQINTGVTVLENDLFLVPYMPLIPSPFSLLPVEPNPVGLLPECHAVCHTRTG